MKVLRCRTLFVFVLAVSVFLLACATPEAQPRSQSLAEQPHLPPPLPSSFYGRVQINGQDVPEGTLISVGSAGVVYAQTTSLLYEGESVYSINVPGDHSDTPEREGGREGEALEFTVAGLRVRQTATWRSGSNEELSLNGANEAHFLKLVRASVYLPFVVRVP